MVYGKIFFGETYSKSCCLKCFGEGNAMYDVKRVIGELGEESREYLTEYFKSAPAWLMNAMQVIKIRKDQAFICEGEAADKVYILLKGKVTGIDYRVKETAYGYLKFHPVEVFGAMEIILNMDKYRTTLQTVENSLFLRVDREKFSKWMNHDINAYRMSSEKTCGFLLEEVRKERLYVLIQGVERIYLALYELYQMYEHGGTCNIYVSRRDFTQITGVSERTVTRTITALVNKGYLSKDGWNIVITREQSKKIKALIENKIQEIGVNKYELF